MGSERSFPYRELSQSCEQKVREDEARYICVRSEPDELGNWGYNLEPNETMRKKEEKYLKREQEYLEQRIRRFRQYERQYNNIDDGSKKMSEPISKSDYYDYCDLYAEFSHLSQLRGSMSGEKVIHPTESTLTEEKVSSSEDMSISVMPLLASSLFPTPCDTSKNGTMLTEAKQLVSNLLQKTDDYDSRTELYQLTQLLNCMTNR